MSRDTVYFRGNDGRVFETNFPEYHKGEERLTRAEGERLYKEQCRAELRKLLKPGQTVYCMLRHVSSSGMQRRISLYIVTPAKKGQPAGLRSIDGLAATATDYTLSDKGGIVASGCGMDMGFALVYSLGAAVWPKGTRKPHSTRNGEPDNAGGYALKHQWL